MDRYWTVVWKQFKKSRSGLVALYFLGLICLLGLYAPLMASSKPFVVFFGGKLYFPLLRYLFYPGFFTKPIDLFYNVLMLILPLTILGWVVIKKRWRPVFVSLMIATQISLFALLSFGIVKDPASHTSLIKARHKALKKQEFYSQDPLLAPFAAYPDWNFELPYMTSYAKLNLLLRHTQRKDQHVKLGPERKLYLKARGKEMPTLWANDWQNERLESDRLGKTTHTLQEEYNEKIVQLPELLASYRPFSHDLLIAKFDLEQAQRYLKTANRNDNGNKKVEEASVHLEELTKRASSIQIPLQQARQTIQHYRDASARLNYLTQRKEWLEKESGKLHVIVPALVRSFHWEDDAGGDQSINKYVSWWQLTRINRKDLVASLLFGIRISVVIGLSVVVLSLLIGIPLGTISGYFAGKTDIVICRIIEIWEAMPTFFMLLLIVAITQSKSLFLIMGVLGIFGWTGFGRFIRGEALKQRNLPYVLACKNLGFRHPRIMFSHILPNAIPPILTLLPFSMMAAITSEAALSFLGLGEEGSTSWGVLMSEGRSVFPGESYLLWPPAIMLTLLLVSIALVGDALRDAIDPKLRQ
ncbi:MAG: Oligopeptide transport system permease protein OppC [Chlamydiae bacterium]|nr:Oligopeptide transport system permease protein OppC [Chlamydiota bacterium]